MTTCLDYLKLALSSNKAPSGYALSRKIGLSPQRMSQLLTKGGTYSDETAIKLAEVLEIDPLPVVLMAHAERAKCDSEKSIWNDALTRLGGHAA